MINQLLNDHSINEGEVYNLLNSLSETGSDYSDLYFQHSVAESWVLDEGIVKDGSYNISHGVGARCVSGDKTGFSYSDDLNIRAIQGAVDFAKGISNGSSKGGLKILKTVKLYFRPPMLFMKAFNPQKKEYWKMNLLHQS